MGESAVQLFSLYFSCLPARTKRQDVLTAGTTFCGEPICTGRLSQIETIPAHSKIFNTLQPTYNFNFSAIPNGLEIATIHAALMKRSNGKSHPVSSNSPPPRMRLPFSSHPSPTMCAHPARISVWGRHYNIQAVAFDLLIAFSLIFPRTHDFRSTTIPAVKNI